MNINPYFRVVSIGNDFFIFDCKLLKEYKIITNTKSKISIESFIMTADEILLEFLKNINFIV